jgi:hypothetical protein
MIEFINNNIGFFSMLAGYGITFSLFLLRINSRIDRHEIEICDIKEEQREIKQIISSDTKDIKDELRRVSSNVENLKNAVSEMAGYFRGKGHDIKSCD